MKFILGKKLNMTQVFREDGEVVPVTRVQAGPCQITQISSRGKDFFVQIGFGEMREKNMTKSEIGHLKDLNKVRNLREFNVDQKIADSIKRGDNLTVEMFVTGELASVTGISKGKGFQGVVKRYNFKGGPASHGHKDQLRMPGSIGATGPQKVFKGTKMGGRMGGDQITVKNLEIVQINPELNELFIKGAVPGARNGLIVIKTEGDLQIKQTTTEEAKEETKEEEKIVVEEKVIEKPVEEVEVKEEIKEEVKSEEKEEVKPE